MVVLHLKRATASTLLTLLLAGCDGMNFFSCETSPIIQRSEKPDAAVAKILRDKYRLEIVRSSFDVKDSTTQIVWLGSGDFGQAEAIVSAQAVCKLYPFSHRHSFFTLFFAKDHFLFEAPYNRMGWIDPTIRSNLTEAQIKASEQQLIDGMLAKIYPEKLELLPAATGLDAPVTITLPKGWCSQN